MSRFGFVLLPVMALACSVAEPAAAYTITIIDAPGSPGNTQPTGINDLGQVVGMSSVGNFIDLNGTFNQITGAQGNVTGINNSGQVSGYAYTGFSPATGDGYQAFIYSNGTLYNLPATAADNYSTATFAYGINNVGVFVGAFTGPGNVPFEATEAGSFTPEPAITTLLGINDAGQTVGYEYNPATGYVQSYGYINGAFTFLSVPGSRTGTVAQGGFTYVAGINNEDQVVGNYTAVNGQSDAFLDDGGVFTTLNGLGGIPGNAVVKGINNEGQIVGYYQDAVGVHGFIATPTTVPEPASFALLGVGLAMAIAVRRSSPIRQP